MLALICKHFNMPGPLVDDLAASEFIQYYALGLDLEERDVFEKYVLAGGDPDKFQWAGEWELPETVGDKIFQFASERMKTKPKQIDLAEIAEIQGGYDVVYQLEDGTFTDADGNPIEVPPGHKFVKSAKLKEAMLDNFMGT